MAQADPQVCPFDRAILSGCCACTLAARHSLAEREFMVCRSEVARERCFELLDLLRKNSAFAIGELHDSARLTHAQNMKIQCGGLRGLQFELDGGVSVTDVSDLVSRARRRFGAMTQFPYSHIVREVAGYQPRKRHDET